MALGELRRVVRPGAALGLTVKQGDGQRWTHTARGRRFFAYWQPGELDVALAGAGWACVSSAAAGDRRGQAWLWRLAMARTVTS
jgi:hypothetical protein